MAKINDTSAYAPAATPYSGSSILIGSEGVGGATNNFLLSEIATYVQGVVGVPTLDDVCLSGNTTTTSMQIGGAGGLSILSGPLTSNGSTFLLGTATINGALDANSTADIADTLTLSKASGVGLFVTSNAQIAGTLEMGVGDGVITRQITAPTSSNIAFYLGGVQRGAFTAPLGLFTLNYGLRVISGGGRFDEGLTTTELIVTGAVPASATSAGIAGQIATDTDYIYVCTATNTWKRVAIATW